MAVHHGGKLLEAISAYGGELSQWVDLSTGVSPFTYPVGNIPDRVWNRLPEQNDGLEQAAKAYYHTNIQPLAVAGSQAAIMQLPWVLTQVIGKCGTVCLPRVGYKEHQKAWQDFNKDGRYWNIEFYDNLPSQKQIAKADVVLVINPNNPTGFHSNADELLAIHEKLKSKNGYLVVDEAFMDCEPENSLLMKIGLSTNFPSHLCVLRSVGKFFGLAGLRVGFVFASTRFIAELEEKIGPWTVTGPSRWVITQAFNDHKWQQSNRERITESMTRLRSLVHEKLSACYASTQLFITVYLDNAEQVHTALCQNKVYTRLCDEKDAIRLGLPEHEWQWQQLAVAFDEVTQQFGYKEHKLERK